MEIKIEGVVDIDMPKDEFEDKFIEFVRSLGGYFGGGINEYDEDEE